MVKNILKNQYLGLVTILIFSFFLMTYRITETPMGLTADEAAFGWNAILLYRTGYDENGVHLPLFVNSLNKKDWRQPWTQYYIALYYKIFGASIYNLRTSSVVLLLFSSSLLYYLVKKLSSHRYALFSIAIFLTTPIVFMQSHLGLDNIMPIPFVLIWIITLYKYQEQPSPKLLLIAGLALGSSFYAYKGMRATVPVWAALTCAYIYFLKPYKLISFIKEIIPFVIGIAPSIIAIPIISHLYPGAIFGGSRPEFSSVYNFFYPYFSAYDLTFMYIKGDDLLFHSTQMHGMVLLSTLPLFFTGLYQSIKKRGFWLFVTIIFFTGPLLYGLIGSIHRASRIMSIIPAYTIICTLGMIYLTQQFKKTKVIIAAVIILILLNFLDFTNYYWYTYPKFTENIFGNMKSSATYKEFAYQAKKLNLKPYINKDVYDGYIDLINFQTPTTQIYGDAIPPKGSIYLTFHDKLPGMERLNVNIPQQNILIRE